MFGFIKQALIVLSRFSGSIATKCIILHQYPFMISLDKYSSSCNALDDLECVFRII